MPKEAKEETNNEDKMKAKRDINTKKKKSNATTKDVKLRRDELIVQRLSATVSGKAQKFSRIGPREFVPYPQDDLTVRGIKKACLAHFGRRVSGMECDILAGEQGPSCNSLEQVNINKVIHVRFVTCDHEAVSVPDTDSSEESIPVAPKKAKNRKHVSFDEVLDESPLSE